MGEDRELEGATEEGVRGGPAVGVGHLPVQPEDWQDLYSREGEREGEGERERERVIE